MMKIHKKETITATDLARNLASTIDQVRLSGQVIDITRGNQIVAQLVPATQKGFPVSQLDIFFHALPHLGSAPSVRMASDLKKIRDNATLPESPWES